MKLFKKIVGFGDSWIYGDELIDPAWLATSSTAHSSDDQTRSYREQHCFLGLLGKHYNLPVENYGIPGGSLQSTIWTFLKWFQKESNLADCLVLIGLTEANRFTLWNPDGNNDDRKMVHSTWVEAGASHLPRDFHQLVKQQIALTISDESNKLNYNQTVLFFDGVASRYQLPLLQFHISSPLEPLHTIPTLQDPDQSFTRWFVHEIQPKHGRKYIHQQGHPNELGHELVRDRLISWIESSKILE